VKILLICLAYAKRLCYHISTVKRFLPLLPLETSMTNLSSFSWVRGSVYGAEVFGDYAILDQGGAFALVQISSRDYVACCPTFTAAFKALRKRLVA
jgi:hypothetical protein